MDFLTLSTQDTINCHSLSSYHFLFFVISTLFFEYKLVEEDGNFFFQLPEEVVVQEEKSLMIS